MSGRTYPPVKYLPESKEEPSPEDKKAWLVRKIHGYLLDCKPPEWIAVELGQPLSVIEELIPEVIALCENLTGPIRKSYAALGFAKLERGLQTLARRLFDEYEMPDPRNPGQYVTVPGWQLLKPSDHVAFLGILNNTIISQARLCGAIGTGDQDADAVARRTLGNRFALGGDIGQAAESHPDALNKRMREIIHQSEHKGAENARRVNGNGAHA